MDYEVDENTDLTSPPKTDTILEQIEKLTLGELDLKPEGGEVVDINGWKSKKSSKIDSLKDHMGVSYTVDKTVTKCFIMAKISILLKN